jgi:hypothetical protein
MNTFEIIKIVLSFGDQVFEMFCIVVVVVVVVVHARGGRSRGRRSTQKFLSENKREGECMRRKNKKKKNLKQDYLIEQGSGFLMRVKRGTKSGC